MTIRSTITKILTTTSAPNAWLIEEHDNGTATLHVHNEAEVAKAKALYGVIGPWPKDAEGHPELRLAEGP